MAGLSVKREEGLVIQTLNQQRDLFIYVLQ